MLSWVNGAPGEQLSVRDRGLAYGDGLFETIAVQRGQPRLLARHLARLQQGSLVRAPLRPTQLGIRRTGACKRIQQPAH